MKKQQVKRKAPRKKPEKSHLKNRNAERAVKQKALSKYIDEQINKHKKHDTWAQDVLVCPHCGWKHDPEDLEIEKKSEGLIKCSDCGQGFSFEKTTKVAYTTFEE